MFFRNFDIILKNEIYKTDLKQFPQSMPKRLINVYNYKIFETKNIEPEPYATVSHVWSQKMEYNGYKNNYAKMILACHYCQYLEINWLWMDNFCILQNNDDESLKDKNEQIPKMSDYYKNASICIVIMTQNGELLYDEIYIKELLKLFSLDKDPFEQSEYMWDELHGIKNNKHENRKNKILNIIDNCNFMKNNWYNRAWTLQEAIFSKNLHLIMEQNVIDLSYLFEQFKYIINDEKLYNNIIQLYKYINIIINSLKFNYDADELILKSMFYIFSEKDIPENLEYEYRLKNQVYASLKDDSINLLKNMVNMYNIILCTINNNLVCVTIKNASKNDIIIKTKIKHIEEENKCLYIILDNITKNKKDIIIAKNIDIEDYEYICI